MRMVQQQETLPGEAGRLEPDAGQAATEPRTLEEFEFARVRLIHALRHQQRFRVWMGHFLTASAVILPILTWLGMGIVILLFNLMLAGQIGMRLDLLLGLLGASFLGCTLSPAFMLLYDYGKSVQRSAKACRAQALKYAREHFELTEEWIEV